MCLCVSQEGGVSACVSREGVSVCVGVSIYELEGGVSVMGSGRCVYVWVRM